MVKWSPNSDLWLFTIAEFNQLPDGVELTCINGTETKVKGVDDIDLDTRFGYIAWGVNNPNTHKLGELFTVFMLKKCSTKI